VSTQPKPSEEAHTQFLLRQVPRPDPEGTHEMWVAALIDQRSAVSRAQGSTEIGASQPKGEEVLGAAGSATVTETKKKNMQTRKKRKKEGPVLMQE
jgi:hypothetical protein